MNQPKNVKHHHVVMIEVNKLPNLFRVQKLSVERTSDHAFIYKATLYSETDTIKVTWLSSEERKDLRYGVLVRGLWLTRRIFAQGTNIIQSLQRVKNIGVDDRLSTTVFKSWIYDGFAYAFVFDHIEQLPIAYRKLITNVLLDHYVLYHFLKTPVCLKGDLYQLGSNFQKTAELLSFLERNIHAHKFNAPREVLITAGLLIGIGHYNQFEYDHKTHEYHAHDLTHVHDPKIVAIGLIHKAAERAKNIDLEIINRVVAVIDHLEFEY